IGAALEFAAGTGLWTQRLAPHCAHLTALDAAPETLAINRARLGAAAERVDAFWALVRDCLAPDGRVFLIDSLYTPTSTAHDHQLGAEDTTTLRRRLNDGSEYHIYKV